MLPARTHQTPDNGEARADGADRNRVIGEWSTDGGTTIVCTTHSATTPAGLWIVCDGLARIAYLDYVGPDLVDIRYIGAWDDQPEAHRQRDRDQVAQALAGAFECDRPEQVRR